MPNMLPVKRNFYQAEFSFMSGISGLSGMANMFCKILNHLDIHPYSKEGKVLCASMAAFIVGSGMHSYEEVYASFNAYAQLRFMNPVTR
jgi:hypothetical protein